MKQELSLAELSYRQVVIRYNYKPLKLKIVILQTVERSLSIVHPLISSDIFSCHLFR